MHCFFSSWLLAHFSSQTLYRHLKAPQLCLVTSSHPSPWKHSQASRQVSLDSWHSLCPQFSQIWYRHHLEALQTSLVSTSGRQAGSALTSLLSQRPSIGMWLATLTSLQSQVRTVFPRNYLASKSWHFPCRRTLGSLRSVLGDRRHPWRSTWMWWASQRAS